jgi:predicted DNA-binding protein YlxM (UPF0122 family)
VAEYVTISEFAKMAGVSRQAVYKRIDKDLKGYIIKDGNKLKISTDALCLGDIKVTQAAAIQTSLAPPNELSTIVNLINKCVEIEKQNQIINNVLAQQIAELGKSLDKLTQVFNAAAVKFGSTLVEEDKKVKKSIWQCFISRKFRKNRDINPIAQKNK